MSFLLFIILVLVLVLLQPILKIWLQIRRVRNAYRDMAREQQQAYERNTHTRKGKGKSKIFSRNEGEYVEFTEIEVTETTEPPTPAGDTSVPYEEQISDAEWEEIK